MVDQRDSYTKWGPALPPIPVAAVCRPQHVTRLSPEGTAKPEETAGSVPVSGAVLAFRPKPRPPVSGPDDDPGPAAA